MDDRYPHIKPRKDQISTVSQPIDARIMLAGGVAHNSIFLYMGGKTLTKSLQASSSGLSDPSKVS
jgi:hypothetical protein